MTLNNLNSVDQPFAYSEATATWSVRYVDPAGFECILSIQAETGAEVLRKAESALSHLDDAKCLPVHKNSFKGNGHVKEHNSAATILIKSNGNIKNPICPIHNIEMQKWSKNGRTWYSHRWNNGWCNGKKQ